MYHRFIEQISEFIFAEDELGLLLKVSFAVVIPS